jgi:hypothetical protein
MPTVIDKLVGTFKLGDTSTGVSFEAQISQIGTPQTVTRDSPVVVLTGDVITPSAIYSWSIVGQVLLDMSDPSGIYYFVNTNQGQTMPFEFCPIGPTAGPTITGSCIVDGWDTEEIAAGSIAQSKFTWPIQGQVTRTPPA